MNQSIPVKKVKIILEKIDPTELTAESLEKQLHDIGLRCEHSQKEKLKKYKEEVERKIPNGLNQSYAVLKPKASMDGSPYYKSKFSGGPLLGYEKSSDGDWQPSGSGFGYSTELSTVIYPRNFDYLKSVKGDKFTGSTSGDRIVQDKLETVEAIKELFIQVGIEASASLIQGLDKTTLNSILSNAISPLNDTKAQNYDQTDSRVVFLVLNYDPETQEADAIGALGIDWRLEIKDYKEKKKQPLHDTKLTLQTRSILYDDIKTLDADVLIIQSRFGDDLFGSIPPKTRKLKIFDKLPPENKDTFMQGMPVLAKNEYIDVIILYAPNLQAIGCIDNSESDLDTSYSKTVTSGFTFEMGQKISVGAEFEAGVVFAKGKVSVGFELSFTESWNRSESETITFTAEAGEKAFTYQGYVLSRHLRFLPETQEYQYVGEEGRFLTNILKTSKTPIIGDVTFPNGKK